MALLGLGLAALCLCVRCRRAMAEVTLLVSFTEVAVRTIRNGLLDEFGLMIEFSNLKSTYARIHPVT